jgi:hypothetical protein
MQDITLNHNKSVFLIKKTEKLCTAVYLITNHISDKEALRTRIRIVCLDILDGAILLVSDRVRTKSLLDRLSLLLTQTISLLSILEYSGFVSSANSELVRSQCEQIDQIGKEIFSEYQNFNTRGFGLLLQGEGNQQYEITNDLFLRSPQEESLLKKFLSPILLSDTNENSFHNPSRNSDMYSRSALEDTRRQGVLNNNQNPHKLEGLSPILKKSDDVGAYLTQNRLSERDRRDGILLAIKKCGRANIKEILKHVPGCGEKTIQREIASLIQEGVVERIGKRRWSLYSLSASALGSS